MANSIKNKNNSPIGDIWEHMGRLWVHSHEKSAQARDYQDRGTDIHSR